VSRNSVSQLNHNCRFHWGETDPVLSHSRDVAMEILAGTKNEAAT
jgi:hypothetical protein